MYSEQLIVDHITANTTYTNVSCELEFQVENLVDEGATLPLIRVQHILVPPLFEINASPTSLEEKDYIDEKLITSVKFVTTTTDWVEVWLELRKVLKTFELPVVTINDIVTSTGATLAVSDYRPFTLMQANSLLPPGSLTAWEFTYILSYPTLG